MVRCIGVAIQINGRKENERLTNRRLGFRIFYADQSIVNGVTLEDWDNAPDEGVIAIQEVFSKGNRKMDRYTIQVHADQDYYWMVPEFTQYTVKNVQHTAEAFEIVAGAARLIPENAHLKTGAIVGDAVYSRIISMAQRAPVYGSFA